MRRPKQILDSFCQQFDLSLPKPTCNGSCFKPTTSKPNKQPHKRIAHKYKKNISIPNVITQFWVIPQKSISFFKIKIKKIK